MLSLQTHFQLKAWLVQKQTTNYDQPHDFHLLLTPMVIAQADLLGFRIAVRGARILLPNEHC